MHDAPEVPDDSHLFPSAVVDSVEALGVSQVGEDRFDGTHAVAVAVPSFGGVDLVPHGLAMGACGLDADAQGTTFAVFTQAA